MRDVTRTIISSEINPVRTIRTEEPNVIIYLLTHPPTYLPMCVTSGLSTVLLEFCVFIGHLRPICPSAVATHSLSAPRDHCANNIIYL